MKANSIVNIIFKPKRFFEAVNANEVSFIFAIAIVLLSYFVSYMVYEVLGYSVFIPESIRSSNLDTVIYELCNLFVFPLLAIYFLRHARKHVSQFIFIAFYSLYAIEILLDIFMLLMGTISVINKNNFFYLVVPFSVWHFLLLFLAIHVLSGLPRVKSIVVFIKTFIVAMLVCGLITVGPKFWKAWENVQLKKTTEVSYPYTIKNSEGKLLAYNMNSPGQEPNPIRCITKDKDFVNIFLEIQFRLMDDKLKDMYEKYEEFNGYYELALNIQISDIVKQTVRNNYTLEEAVFLKTDELKVDLTHKIKYDLSRIGFDVIDLKIIKVEQMNQ